MRSLPANARAWLEPALDPEETFTWADIEALHADNRLQIWLGDDCAIATQLFGEPADGIHVWLGGGSLTGLLNLRPRIEETARFWGCRKATINGRLGWDRVLKPHGYTRNGDELEKTL